MCGRITLLTYDELEEVLAAVEARRRGGVRVTARDGRTQARPGSVVHAIAPGENGLAISPFIWGFTFPNSKKLIFNTRIESALGGTRMWAGPIRDGRCVLPAATFFEPHGSETATSPRTGRAMKRQYEFASPDGEPLLLAGVHDGERLSVITTEPNASVAPIHPRMPLALRFEEVPTWLGDNYASLADRSRFELTAHPEDDASALPQLSLF
ncbi:MAG: SOS response-associated peptidase family protein [Eggerthellaceae bacterium]|nr:SOS response-associated peptidase family protein [Eggerthellaceae bacterium]